jgi:hypothetical protein
MTSSPPFLLRPDPIAALALGAARTAPLLAVLYAVRPDPNGTLRGPGHRPSDHGPDQPMHWRHDALSWFFAGDSLAPASSLCLVCRGVWQEAYAKRGHSPGCFVALAAKSLPWWSCCSGDLSLFLGWEPVRAFPAHGARRPCLQVRRCTT